MKPCIRCKEVKPIDEFYAHPMMGDGHLNKCKACCKEQARERHYRKTKNDPVWVESERERHRQKFRRLGSGWRVSPSAGENAARLAAKRVIPTIPAGMERHHWSYRRDHWADVILLRIDNHRALHQAMTYDEQAKQFRTRRGHLMDTKAKHIRYMLAVFNERARVMAAA